MKSPACEHPFFLDQHGCFTAPAASAAKLFGVRASDLIGRRMDAYITREDGPAFLEALLEAYRGVRGPSICLDMITHNQDWIEADIRFEPKEYDVHGRVVSVQGTVCRCRKRKK